MPSNEFGSEISVQNLDHGLLLSQGCYPFHYLGTLAQEQLCLVHNFLSSQHFYR